MAKFKKAALCTVLAAVAAVSLMFVGCSGGGAEINGTYRYLTCMPSTIEQGWLVQNLSGGMTTASNNTYSGFTAVLSMYSSDGTSYSPAYSTWVNVYGSFEVVYEDETLNETTIKITTVDRVEVSGGEYTYDQLPEEAKSAVDTSVVGTEIILQSDGSLSELPPFLSVGMSFGTGIN